MSRLDSTPAGTEYLLDETGKFMNINNMVTYTRRTVTAPINMAAWTADISRGRAPRRRATAAKGCSEGNPFSPGRWPSPKGLVLSTRTYKPY